MKIKKLLALCSLLVALCSMLYAPVVSAATVGVCNMPSAGTVQVQIYDITTVAETVAWTTTGVSERANGQGKSCYYYNAALTAGNEYQIDWKDNSSPIKTASEIIAEFQTMVDAKISTRSTYAGGAVASVTAPVTVGTNSDKAGYSLAVTPPTVTDIWGALLPGAYGAGTAGKILGSYPAVVLPVLQGQAYTAVAAQSKEISIIRGDTIRITFDLGTNYSAGWTPKFGAKSNPADTAYVIAVKDATWTDATKGQGYVDLTSTETGAVGRLYGEIELRNGAQRLTAIKFVLKISQDVIN